MRGNRGDQAVGVVGVRSIPACAGEPRSAGWRGRTPRVYPRVCGGTGYLIAAWLTGAGLSPRVRGNRVIGALAREERRSIPACAGEPSWGWPPPAPAGVYPRVCGGTFPPASPACGWRGLSPRVRGNRQVAGTVNGNERSIPACAGEPKTGTRRHSRIEVYPRVCGGTISSYANPLHTRGLSPRVRGNRSRRRFTRRQPGSIPACAGEPFPPPLYPPATRVYPRVCGGTTHDDPLSVANPGLSPRVRGNRHHSGGKGGMPRSIPACAGEPMQRRERVGVAAVYPRVCGGTGARRCAFQAGLGLSPRVRGNPFGDSARCPR